MKYLSILFRVLIIAGFLGSTYATCALCRDHYPIFTNLVSPNRDLLEFAVLRLFVWWPWLGIIGLVALLCSRWTNTAHTALVAIIYVILMVGITASYPLLRNSPNIAPAMIGLELFLVVAGLIGTTIFSIKGK